MAEEAEVMIVQARDIEWMKVKVNKNNLSDFFSIPSIETASGFQTLCPSRSLYLLVQDKPPLFQLFLYVLYFIRYLL